MKHPNPEMLALAREARGLTQADLAQRIHASQGRISKYENGLLPIPEADVAKLASALDFHKEFFYQEPQLTGLGASFLFHRKRQSVRMRVLRRLEAEANIRQLQVRRLLRGARIETQNRFEILDIDMFDDEPEAVARHVRASWQLPTGPIRNLVQCVEAAGGIVIPCHFETRQIDAAHLWRMPEPPLFFIHDDLLGDRQRFTLAHEVGHAVMHTVPSRDGEEEAHRFAAELLMPAQEIRSQLYNMTIEKAVTLKAHWKVAMQALIKRSKELGCISDRQYRRLFTRLSSRGYRTNEPVPIPAERPAVFADLIRVHRLEHGYSQDDLAAIMLTDDPLFYPEEDAQPLLWARSNRLIIRHPRA